MTEPAEITITPAPASGVVPTAPAPAAPVLPPGWPQPNGFLRPRFRVEARVAAFVPGDMASSSAGIIVSVPVNILTHAYGILCDDGRRVDVYENAVW